MPMSGRLALESPKVPDVVEESRTSGTPGPAADAIRQEGTVWSVVFVGFLVAVAGLVDGIVMASKRHVAPCPDGKYFPEGTTNFDCYVHPNAGLGIAIALFSILLGIVVWLAGTTAVATLRGHATRGPNELAEASPFLSREQTGQAG